MKKITLLAASVLLLLTACGQVENSPAEVAPPTTAVVQQPQATPESTTTAQKPDTVPIITQEQLQPPLPQRTSPPRLSTPRQAMWNRSLHRNQNLLPTPQPRQTGRWPLTRPTPTRCHSMASPRTEA